MHSPSQADEAARSALQFEKMTKTPVPKLILGLAAPTILSMLITSIYNLADTFFVGQLSTSASGAVGVVSSLMAIIQALGFMLGHGAGGIISRSLGNQDTHAATKFASTSFFTALVFGIVLAGVGLSTLPGFMMLLGSTDTILPHACAYARPILIAAPLMMSSLVMNNILRYEGKASFAMIGLVTGGVLNILLDPIFIFGFRWGMMGAAVATVIGQVVTAALAVWYLLHMKIIRPAWADLRLKGSICGRTLTLGMTSFLSQISLVAAMAAINNMIRKYGALDAVFGQEQYAQIPMAVVGIVMKFFQIVISIVVGMAAGCIPIVGYNMGAGKKMRVRKLFTMLLAAEALVGAVALILAEGFPRQLIAIFGAANESSYYADFAVKAFRTYLCMMVLACINKACFIFLQAIGKALASTLLSMFREVVFGVGFALLLPVFFGLDGVLYSMPVSDVLTFVISAFIIAKTYKELNTEGVDRV